MQANHPLGLQRQGYGRWYAVMKAARDCLAGRLKRISDLVKRRLQLLHLALEGFIPFPQRLRRLGKVVTQPS